jgi:hypothetical protein
MEPRNWDGATVDRSVRNRLRRLDKNLRVCFSPYALDPLTGRVIEMDGYGENCERLVGALRDPAFYLWHRTDKYGWALVQTYPLANGFDHLDVLRLESDLARHKSPEEAWRILHGKRERQRRAQIQSEQNRLRDKAIDNKKLIRDAAAGDDGFFRRQPKAFGYSGQRTRTSSGEGGYIIRSDHELGL